MDRVDGLTFCQLQDRLERDGVRPFHASALFRNLHQGAGLELESPAENWFRGKEITPVEQALVTESADGYTRKYLLSLSDGQEVESVLMGYPGRHTACLSSQVGCAMGCVFCATGQMGFRRHLSAGEIVAQVRFLNERLAEREEAPLRNLVMMGMGEPLHNFGALMDALEILTDTRGLQLRPSRVSISTVGHVNGILKLAEVPKNYQLSVSLHGASDEERSALIPINRRWPLEELLAACETFAEKKKQRVFVAWTLIAGVNDSDDHARRLASLLKGRPVHVNLIPLNVTPDFEGKPPSEERTKAFHEIVRREAELPVTIRQRRGIDVDAGCGQLAGRSRS